MCQTQATASDLLIYNTFVLQKASLSTIYGDVIACDLWFGPPPQSKILATPMTYPEAKSKQHVLHFFAKNLYFYVMELKEKR